MTATEEPMDLSVFLDVQPSPEVATDGALVVHDSQPGSAVAIPEPLEPRRLVDISRFPPPMMAKAEALAKRIDVRRSETVHQFISETTSPVATVSRKMLSDITVGDAGEIGRVAAAVIDGIRILRIDEMREQAQGVAPKATGVLGRVFGVGKVASDALKGFAENRKRFLTLMNQEEAKARRTAADLLVTIELQDEQLQEVRSLVSNLAVAIGACQLALEAGERDYEVLRQTALRSNDPGDAALALDCRGRLLNFASMVQDLRESQTMTASMVPIIAANRQAAETRRSKLTTAIHTTIPGLILAASQAAIAGKSAAAAAEVEKLGEAQRQVAKLAAGAAHDAAIGAARSLGGDQRNIEALHHVADQAIRTMQEVADIEADVARQLKERENELLGIRDKLVEGMVGVQQKRLAAA